MQNALTAILVEDAPYTLIVLIMDRKDNGRKDNEQRKKDAAGNLICSHEGFFDWRVVFTASVGASSSLQEVEVGFQRWIIHNHEP